MSDQPVCILCGCALTAGDSVCPMCGTPVGQTGDSATAVPVQADDVAGAGDPMAGAASAPRHASPAGRSRAKRIAVVAVAAVVVVTVAAALVVRAWLGDRSLQERADDTSGATSSAVVSRQAAATLSAKSTAAGGLVVMTGEGPAVGGRSSLLVAAAEQSDDAFETLLREGSPCVCELNGTVYRLVCKDVWSAPFEGVDITPVWLDRRDPPESHSVLWDQDTGDEYADRSALSSLCAYGDSIWYLARKGDSQRVMRIAHPYEPDDYRHVPAEAFSFSAERAWLAPDSEGLLVASSAGGAWSVQRLLEDAAADGQMKAQQLAKGEGDLAVACPAESGVYYCLSKKGARLQRADLKGGFTEYADVTDAISIAAAGDSVAVVSKSGDLVWVDAVTGVVHDLTGEMKRLLPDAQPTRVAIGVQGTWVYLADDQGAVVRIGMDGAAGERVSGDASSIVSTRQAG